MKIHRSKHTKRHSEEETTLTLKHRGSRWWFCMCRTRYRLILHHRWTSLSSVLRFPSWSFGSVNFKVQRIKNLLKICTPPQWTWCCFILLSKLDRQHVVMQLQTGSWTFLIWGPTDSQTFCSLILILSLCKQFKKYKMASLNLLCNKKPLKIFLPYREWAWPQYWWYLIAAQEVERVVHSLEGCWFDYPPPSAACWSISEQDTEPKNCECDKCFKAVWAVSKPVQRCRSISSFTLIYLAQWIVTPWSLSIFFIGLPD